MSDQAAQQENNWIWHKDAAPLMGVNEKFLRLKDKRGFFLYWPQLDRIQPIPRGRIYLRRDQIAAWKQQQEQIAARNKAPEFRESTANPFNGMREMLAENGWHDLAKKLGVQI